MSFRINYKFTTGLTTAEESRNEDLAFREKKRERVKNKKNIEKRNKESLQRDRLCFFW